MKNKKILILNRALGNLFGGGEYIDVEIAKNFKKLGYDVYFGYGKNFFKKENNLEKIKELKNLSIKVFGIKTPYLTNLAYKLEKISIKLSAIVRIFDRELFYFNSLKWLKKQNIKFDVIQVIGSGISTFKYFNYAKKIAVWLPGPPDRIMQRYLIKLSKKNNFVLWGHGTPIEFIKNSLNLKIYPIGPGIYFYKYKNVNLEKNDKYRSNSITVARIVPIKNYKFLVNGIKEVVKIYPNYKHLIVGDGSDFENIKNYIKELGLEKNIILKGYLPFEKIVKYLFNTDFFILTSKYESFSIAILESFIFKKPVICTNIGYLPKLIKDSGGGELVELNNTKDLTNKIIKFYKNSELRKEYGKNGYNYVQKHDWDNIIKELENLYFKKS